MPQIYGGKDRRQELNTPQAGSVLFAKDRVVLHLIRSSQLLRLHPYESMAQRGLYIQIIYIPPRRAPVSRGRCALRTERDRATSLRCSVIAYNPVSARPTRHPHFRLFIAIPECIYKLPCGPYTPPDRASLSFQGWLLLQWTGLSRIVTPKSTPSKSGGWLHHSCSSSESPTTALSY